MIPKPKNPRMTHSLNRRLTFNLWPGNFSDEFVISGLYFTGDLDILACCWCNHLMGNWDNEDDPLERHLNENPNCMLIYDQCEAIDLCVYCKKMVPKTKKLPGSRIKEHSERCLETAIATLNKPGKFPRNFRMANVKYRLKSFKKWPKIDTPVEDFVNNGFYYMGQGDAVTCFYCNVTLKDSILFDNLLIEHVKNSPTCIFAQNLLNIVRDLELVNDEDMKNESSRIKTFNNWNFDTDSKELAKIGFFYLGRDDLVECAFCKVIISNKEFRVSDRLLKVHMQKSPMCPFLRGTTLILNPLYPTMLNPMDRLHTFENCSQENVLDFVKSGFYYTGHFVKCFWCGFETGFSVQKLFQTHAEKRPECMFAQNICFQEMNQGSQKNDKNDDLLLCNICFINEREIVFQNCGHLMCCRSCAKRFDKCPGCRRHISNYLRIYIS